MDSHFNNDPPDLDQKPRSAAPAGVSDQAPVSTPQPAEAPGEASAVSAAVIKFRSCRWRRPPDEGVECCGHRDVLPIAGTTSFDPAAWCPDCTFFKLRRMPKKREYY